MSASASAAVGFRVVGHRNIKMKVKERNGFRVSCSSSSSSSSSSALDPYKTLKIEPGAFEADVKKAFRKLALQFHPDVCRESNCGTQFHLINEAYSIVMSKFRKGTYDISEGFDEGDDEPIQRTNDPDWELWEEWMGWEGAGIRDYSSHINPDEPG